MRGTDERTADSYSAAQYTLGSVEADIRCAIPGIIQSYDHEKGTCTVQCAIREKITIDGSSREESIPLLVDVPVVMPRTKDYMLSLFPKKDDECLVIFSDLCIDGWWQSGGEQSQMDNRRHDLSDGFAILAPWSQANKPDKPLDEEGIRVQNVKNKAYFWIKKGNKIVCSATGGISQYGQVIIQGKNENVYIKFADEDIEIKAKNLKVETAEKIDIQATQDISIAAALSISMEATTTIDIKSVAAMTLNATGALTLQSAASAKVEAPTIDLNGTLKINGSPYLAHTHTAPDGGGTTSGVN